MTLRVGIVGISGYTGATIFELLQKHPDVRITYVSANDVSGKVEDILSNLKGTTKLKAKDFEINKACHLCDLIFLAVPHTVSIKIVPHLMKRDKQVIDLSADYRLKDVHIYKKWYKVPHRDSKNLRQAIYGLPEMCREKIKKAQLIANPGCYPTAALLGILPFATSRGKNIESIAIDAKSGVTGAGRKPSRALLYGEVNENCRAYKILQHQHAPEIDLYLSQFSQKKLSADFVPHLLPLNRGILETIYIRLKNSVSEKNIHQLYTRFYKTEPFVRVCNPKEQPQIKNIVKTNYCDIGISVSPNGKLLIVTSAIDNLVKGAAGQAVQNMNIMCQFKETESLL